MGHRASVLYLAEDCGTVHYSHWGAHSAKLLNQISKDAPFGRENMEPEYVNKLLSAVENSDLQAAGELTKPQADTPVEAEPRAIVESVDEWVEEHVNALQHECVYLVDTRGDGEWNVRAFAPMYWRGVDDLGSSAFVLVEAGEKSHALWGGRAAPSWSVFLQEIENDHGTPWAVVEPDE